MGIRTESGEQSKQEADYAVQSFAVRIFFIRYAGYHMAGYDGQIV